MSEDWLDQVHWDSDGLVPVIAQEESTHQVLMMAWMNRESLRLTLEEGRLIYWSRSRQKIWRKGEESGHIQTLKEIRMDCDGDVLLAKVVQQGGIACHTGRHNCFFYRLDREQWVEEETVLKSPESIYRGGVPHKA